MRTDAAGLIEHWKRVAGEQSNRAAEAERRERMIAADRDQWKARAQAAEAKIASLGLIQ
jgi:hypothetical protein